MLLRSVRFVAPAIALSSAGVALAAPVGIDGVIGSEWSGLGVTALQADYNPSAPIGNFGTPTNENHAVAYNTYFRADGEYIYAAVQADAARGGNHAGLSFSNLYFGTTSGGSSVGMEVDNDRFFIPGVAGYFSNAGLPSAYQAVWSENTVDGIIEVAIPIAFFTDDPLGMGFTQADVGGLVRWRMSQSLGYSAVGGESYGEDRLGTYLIPSPAAGVLLAGAGGLLGLRRRRA